MKIPKIVILGFGGTIAMVPNRYSALVPAKDIEELLAYAPRIAKMADIELRQLVNLDSTNITALHWSQLATTIYSLYSKCDAIIVIHGTDTMAYTSGAVSLALGRNVQVPVIFTGAQLPIDAPGNDSVFNLENAVKAAVQAIQEDIAEVMISFSDKVLRAARAIKVSDARFDAFDSPAFPPLAQIAASQVTFSPIANKRIKHGRAAINKPSVNFDASIFTVDVAPGLQPQLLFAVINSGICKGILLKSLGSGNVPSESDYSLLPFIKQSIKQNVPVLIATKFVGGKSVPTLYEPGRKALELGAISTGDMTDVMAQVKLMWLLANNFTSLDDLRQEIRSSSVGEIS
jgi:L-asparaginase